MPKSPKLKLPTVIKSLVHALTKYKSVNVFLVGGAVRDMMLNKTTKDFDLVVTGLPTKKLESELNKLGKVIFVGKTFGVYKLIVGTPEPIDIALPRLDHSLNTGGYRDVKIKTNYRLNINEDLKRRDFTINALAINLKTNELIDPNQGQKHLKQKQILTVGNPQVRFQEDYSRILRALRLSIQLDFTIEKDTWNTIKKLALKAITKKNNGEFILPREIIAREFLKSFVLDPVGTISLWDKASILNILLPEISILKKTPQAKIFHSEGNVYKHTLLALQATTSKVWNKFFPGIKPSPSVLLAILLHDVGKAITMKWVTKNGKKMVTTPEHDTKGAIITQKIIARLKLSSMGESAYKIDADLVEWLVSKHMLLVHGKVDEFKPGTIYRYFFANPTWGMALQQVIMADSWATRPVDGRILFDRLIALRKKINKIKPLLNKKGNLELLLNGNELIKIFSLQPGPPIGKMLKLLTEAQLSKKVSTKKQAILYLTKHL